MLIGLICTPGVKIKVNPHMYVYIQTLRESLSVWVWACTYRYVERRKTEVHLGALVSSFCRQVSDAHHRFLFMQKISPLKKIPWAEGEAMQMLRAQRGLQPPKEEQCAGPRAHWPFVWAAHPGTKSACVTFWSMQDLPCPGEKSSPHIRSACFSRDHTPPPLPVKNVKACFY